MSLSEETWIDFFSGWASNKGGQIFARVHKGHPPDAVKGHESSAEKLLQTIEALELHTIPNAEVEISGVPGLRTVKADGDGFIEVELPAGMHGPLAKVVLTLPETDKFRSSSAEQKLPVWQDQAGQLGIISDIDDTLTDTDVPHKLHMIYNTLFHSQYDVKVFDGAGQAVSMASDGTASKLPTRMLMYLSGSPWNLHTRIAGAFARNGLPPGGFILRRFSKEPLRDAFAFKHPHLQALFQAFPNTRFILLGDTGEKDPEVYAQMHREKPRQIEHVYIHNVTRADPKNARFTSGDLQMTVFNAWSEVHEDLQRRGYAPGGL